MTSASQPALAAIKLAWWREALERLDTAPPPAEPRLQAVQAELQSCGIGGAELAGLEDGWAALLDTQVDEGRVQARGERLFELGARLLGSEPPSADHGRLWAAVDLARRMGRALPSASALPKASPALRPLTVLSALALRDLRRGLPLEGEATPGRSWTMLRHRLTGR